MKELFLLIRPLNCFMAGAALIFSLILSGSYNPFLWTCGFLSVFLICAGGMVVNDFFDRETDRVNNPEKWKRVRKYSEKTLLAFAFSLFFTGLLFAFLLGLKPFALALFNVFLLVLYPSKLKKMVFLKNATVAYLVASIFLYGALISENLLPVLFSLLAFLSNLGREIIKDVVDMEGDKKAGITTLPMIIGETNAKLLFTAFTLSAVLLSPLPYVLGVLGEKYLLFVLPSLLGFAYSCFLSFINPRKASQWSKFSMLLALLAFFGGKFL